MLLTVATLLYLAQRKTGHQFAYVLMTDCLGITGHGQCGGAAHTHLRTEHFLGVTCLGGFSAKVSAVTGALWEALSTLLWQVGILQSYAANRSNGAFS